jgi:hypothetical protein
VVPTRTVLALVGILAVIGAVVAWGVARREPSWGTPVMRSVSPSGDFVAVVYAFHAMIDTGWTVVIERPDGGDQDWMWHAVEWPEPTEIRWLGETEVAVVARGEIYATRFDPTTLRPADRYCMTTGYCREAPFSEYTRTGS